MALNRVICVGNTDLRPSTEDEIRGGQSARIRDCRVSRRAGDYSQKII